MLFVVGGAARSGKSTLARTLLERERVPYVSTDYVVSGLHHGAPELGIRHEDPNPGRSQKVWPILEPMARNILEVEVGYTIEGDVVVPAGVAGLRDRYPGQVRACFLAFPQWSPEHAMEIWKEYPDPINDWLAGLDQPDLLALAEEMVSYSRWLSGECARWNLPFIDVGIGRAESQAQALDELLGAGEDRLTLPTRPR